MTLKEISPRKVLAQMAAAIPAEIGILVTEKVDRGALATLEADRRLALVQGSRPCRKWFARVGLWSPNVGFA